MNDRKSSPQGQSTDIEIDGHRKSGQPGDRPAVTQDGMIHELRCNACGRRYIFVSTAAAPCRACGSALAEVELQRGIYEIVVNDARSATAPDPTSPADTMIPEDFGYGKSHGYGPAHGGPTGPGDAPATDP